MPSRSTPRVLQQQPARQSDAQQQQSGSNDFQPKPTARKKEQQIGEGSYEASRDYKQRAEEYMKNADVEADAEARQAPLRAGGARSQAGRGRRPLAFQGRAVERCHAGLDPASMLA